MMEIVNLYNSKKEKIKKREQWWTRNYKKYGIIKIT